MNPESRQDTFFGLTPERVLEAVEQAGLRTRPVCYALNSYENRVYEVELEDRSRIIAKFYRPSRWSVAQILEEHRFLSDLEDAEVPVCGVIPFPSGETIRTTEEIHYALFRRMGGRAPDEITEQNAGRLGTLLARIHAVGTRSSGHPRLTLDAPDFLDANITWLRENRWVNPAVEADLFAIAADLRTLLTERMEGVEIQRIHGDFHQGNLIEREGVFHVLDFDDMAIGPPVQDLWLLLPGRDAYTARLRDQFIAGYELFRPFDRGSLRLIEPLRGMRMIHYATWLARRWHDPVFPLTWPQFEEPNYWFELVTGLRECVQFSAAEAPSGVEVAPEPEVELTNKDFFWDMEE